jgi:folate-binding protein YgfZ
MTQLSAISVQQTPVLSDIQFDILRMTGTDAVDFLQRISTNDFTRFRSGMVQHTLLVSDKGRIIDTLLVLHRGDDLLILVSTGMAHQVIEFLNKYIIMDDVTVIDESRNIIAQMSEGVLSGGYPAEYFGMKVTITLRHINDAVQTRSTNRQRAIDQWRITNGIPKAGKEIAQEYNPLELNLWDWISFTKGCYIGQEVIARLDTYKKIQRTLCSFHSKDPVQEGQLIMDAEGAEIGKVTTVVAGNDGVIGLCIVRMKHAMIHRSHVLKQSMTSIEIDRVFQKGYDGAN